MKVAFISFQKMYVMLKLEFRRIRELVLNYSICTLCPGFLKNISKKISDTLLPMMGIKSCFHVNEVVVECKGGHVNVVFG